MSQSQYIGVTALRELEIAARELAEEKTHMKGSGRAEAICSMILTTRELIKTNTQYLLLLQLRVIDQRNPDVVEGIKRAILYFESGKIIW